MSRGFIAGAAWGIVVVGVGLVVASQISHVQRARMTEVPPAVEQAGVGGADALADDKPIPPSTAVEQAADVPALAPVIPAMPQDAVPDLASNETGVAAVPALPETSTNPSALPALQGLDAQTPAVLLNPDTQTAALPGAQVAAPVLDAPVVAGTAPSVSVTADSVPGLVDGATAALPDSNLADASPADPDLPPPAPLAVVEASKAEAAPEPTPEPTPEQSVASAEPAVRPAPGFGGKVEGVKIGRLPSIGAAPAVDAGQADNTTEGAEAAALELITSDQPPIDRFARVFENSGGKPLFTILLQDTGGPSIDREALAKLPFPVSFVIDPTQPDAATAAQIYREAGQEILILAIGIPAGANASDIAVSFDAMARVLPESVGVVDLENGGFQGNGTLAADVLAVVADQGRGVISWDRGLNAAAQIARREGMRSALIFRALDAENEGSSVIRRYLDRAAFKAAQDGRVVVAGKTRPETMAALLEWAVEGRAATVAIAPATAVMTGQ